MTCAPPASALPAEPPPKRRYDVVIVGGAMYGSSIAWWLVRNPDFDGSVLVVERNPTYEFTSTAHTNSCMRQQFSSAANIRVSQFAAEFVKNFRHWMDDDPRVPGVAIVSTGYLYLADNESFAAVLRAAQKIQAASGAGTRHMTRAEIAAEYPFYKGLIKKGLQMTGPADMTAGWNGRARRAADSLVVFQALSPGFGRGSASWACRAHRKTRAHGSRWLA